MFLTVEAAGSFTTAAGRLSVAQPVLSRQLRKLEEDLGVDLFYRNGRGVVLTEAGRLLLPHAAKVVAGMDDALETLAAVKESPSGELVVGLPPTVGNILTAPLVRAVRSKFPSVSLTILEGFSGFVLEWLANGRVDIAVLYNAPPTTSLGSDELDEEQLYLFGPKSDQSIGSSQPVDGRLIATLPLVLPSRSHGLRMLIQSAFDRIGLTVTLRYEIDSLPSTRDLVEGGMGYTILPYAPMHDLVHAGRVLYWPFSQPVITRRLVLVTSGKRPVTPVTRNAASMIKQIVGSLRTEGKLSPQPPDKP